MMMMVMVCGVMEEFFFVVCLFVYSVVGDDGEWKLGREGEGDGGSVAGEPNRTKGYGMMEMGKVD